MVIVGTRNVRNAIRYPLRLVHLYVHVYMCIHMYSYMVEAIHAAPV